MSSDPFYDAESSVDASAPVELYQITNQAKIWYHTSGERDIVWGGQLYTATACDRSELGINIVKASFELTIRLPCTHDLAARWVACAGTPPRQVTAVILRLQVDAGVAEQVWSGEITAMTIKAGVANFNVQSLFIERINRQMSTISNGRFCPHVLYDKMCAVDPTGFSFTTTVLFMSGRQIRVDMQSLARVGNDWTVLGDLKHIPSGESMTILQQDDLDPFFSTTSDLTLQAQIAELRVGDSVLIRAGCLHDIITCSTKYSNQVNFGLFPNKPYKNPSFPTGFGVVEQA